VQVDSIPQSKPVLKVSLVSAVSASLKLQYHELLSTFAFNFNLRHYNVVNFSESIKGFYGSLDDPFGNAVAGPL